MYVAGQLRLDSVFLRSYQIDTDVELPSSPTAGAVWYFHGGSLSRTGGHDGLVLRVDPASGPAWYGVFAPSDTLRGRFSTVCTSPDADRFLVIRSGAAYLVSADDPEDWSDLGSRIQVALQVPEHNMLLLGGDGSLAAYGPDAGLLWESERLVLDELEVVSIREGRIQVRGFMGMGKGECALDARSGRLIEGQPVD